MVRGEFFFLEGMEEMGWVGTQRAVFFRFFSLLFFFFFPFIRVFYFPDSSDFFRSFFHSVFSFPIRVSFGFSL